MNNPIEEELTKVTGFPHPYKPMNGVNRQAYLSKLLDAVDSLDSEHWSALSKPAKAWVNEAMAADDEGVEITDFATAMKEDGMATTKKPQKRVVKRKRAPAKEAAAQKPTKRAAPKAKTAPKPEPKAKREGTAAQVMMQVILDEMLAGNKNISRDYVRDEARKAGYELTPTYVATFVSNQRASWKFLQQQGQLKRKLL